MLTVREAAAIIGCNPATVRRWCREDRIPWSGGDRKNGYLIEEDIVRGCGLHLKGEGPLKRTKLDSMGGRLYCLRKSFQKSLEDVAYDIGVTSGDISKFEKDRKIPSIRVLKKMALYYGVTTDYLLCMDKEERV